MQQQIISTITGATSPDVPQDLNVKKLLYKGVYEFNNLDYEYQYVSGFKSMFNFQYVTSRSEMLPEFLIGWNDFSYFRRMWSKGNWATRLRLGIATNNDTPFAVSVILLIEELLQLSLTQNIDILYTKKVGLLSKVMLL